MPSHAHLMVQDGGRWKRATARQDSPRDDEDEGHHRRSAARGGALRGTQAARPGGAPAVFAHKAIAWNIADRLGLSTVPWFPTVPGVQPHGQSTRLRRAGDLGAVFIDEQESKWLSSTTS